MHRRFSLGKAQGFAGIKLAEVDGLGDIGVGFAPVLADFENQPGHVVHFAVAEKIGGAEQEASAVFDESAAPGSEGFEGGGHGRLYVLFARLLMNADYLRRTRGVQGPDLVRRFDALAADDEVVLAPELSTNALDGGAHLAGIVLKAEIVERLVDEWALMGLR